MMSLVIRPLGPTAHPARPVRANPTLQYASVSSRFQEVASSVDQSMPPGPTEASAGVRGTYATPYTGPAIAGRPPSVHVRPPSPVTAAQSPRSLGLPTGPPMATPRSVSRKASVAAPAPSAADSGVRKTLQVLP